MGRRRRGLRRRPDAACRDPRPRSGLCAGRGGQPARPHPRRPDPRRSSCPALLPRRAWQKHSAGAGSHGPRYYSWAWIALLPEDDTDTGRHHLLIRRNDATGELAYLRCYAPRPVTLHTLVTVAGQRWRIEESFQAAKGLTGLDQHQVRRWTSWHRWTTLAMLAHAFLAVATATERDTHPHPDRTDHVDRQRVSTTLRRPTPGHPATPSPACWPGHDGDDDTNTEPAYPTTDDANTNDHELGGSGAGAVANGLAVGLALLPGFPAGSFRFDRGRYRFRFQPPPIKPCMRFSRTRLTDVLHRRRSAFQARNGLGGTTIPSRLIRPRWLGELSTWVIPQPRARRRLPRLDSHSASRVKA